MKQLIVIALLAGTISVGNAQDIQEKDVPSVVLSAFQSKFANAADVEWEREADLFKADFEISNRDHDVWIDKSGNIQKHQEEVTKSDLPEAVNQTLKKQYADFKIDDVDKIQRDNQTYFLVELDGKSGDQEVLFLADGTVQQGQN